MRILVIGSGGREHALVWKLSQSPLVTELLAAPGNGGMELEGVHTCPVGAEDVDALVALAKEEQVDLVVPGPEACLTLGVVDALAKAGVPCFGPDAYCAQMEGSKAFAKRVMREAGVPTAACSVFTDADEALAHVRSRSLPMVVKADGLAAGKGVIIARSLEEAEAAVESIMRARAFGEAGTRVVIEDFLDGEEVSLLCLCDGVRAVPLPSAQDHKAAYDGDQGPNTGGMGAYSPAPILPDSELEAAADLVVRPVLAQLAREGHPFKGVLYAGLMMTSEGPKVLEYNVRFGDPECQPLLVRLEGDLVPIMMACAEGRLNPELVRFSPRSALGVVLVAEGYPGRYEKGMPIEGVPEADVMPDVKVFHSGTRLDGGNLRSSGGRVLCVTALGRDLAKAKRQAYDALARIRMPGSRHRSDIGDKGVARLEREAQKAQGGSDA